MKKMGVLFLFAAIILLSKNSFSQSLRDTIVTKSNDSIVCKITKITDYDIEYVKNSEPDAIGYVISKDKIRMLMLRDGTHEIISRDEMEMNAETEILDRLPYVMLMLVIQLITLITTIRSPILL